MLDVDAGLLSPDLDDLELARVGCTLHGHGPVAGQERSCGHQLATASADVDAFVELAGAELGEVLQVHLDLEAARDDAGDGRGRADLPGLRAKREGGGQRWC